MLTPLLVINSDDALSAIFPFFLLRMYSFVVRAVVQKGVETTIKLQPNVEVRDRRMRPILSQCVRECVFSMGRPLSCSDITATAQVPAARSLVAKSQNGHMRGENTVWLCCVSQAGIGTRDTGAEHQRRDCCAGFGDRFMPHVGVVHHIAWTGGFVGHVNDFKAEGVDRK
ncbi:unnamed protein product [Scytosiphon promiscuus]